MNKFLSILLVALLMICSCQSKNTKTSQESKDVNLMDTLQTEEVGFKELSKDSEIRFVKDIPFYEELLSNLNDPRDTIYICSRHLLNKFNTIEHGDTLVKFGYKQYEVIITSSIFDKKVHSFDLIDTIYKSNGEVDYIKAKNIIDGHMAFGIDGNMPSTELSEFIIKVDQKTIKVSNDFFNDIFNVNLENTEVYYTNERDLIFVYINGSDAAGGYSAKYVINETGYITRIVTNLCGFDFIDGVNYDCV